MTEEGKPVYFITPIEAGWSIREENSTYPLFAFPKKFEAILKAKELKNNDNGVFYLKLPANLNGHKNGNGLKEVCVLPHKQGWSVNISNKETPYMVFSLKNEAIRKAKELSYQLHIPIIKIQL